MAEGPGAREDDRQAVASSALPTAPESPPGRRRPNRATRRRLLAEHRAAEREHVDRLGTNPGLTRDTSGAIWDGEGFVSPEHFHGVMSDEEAAAQRAAAPGEVTGEDLDEMDAAAAELRYAHARAALLDAAQGMRPRAAAVLRSIDEVAEGDLQGVAARLEEAARAVRARAASLLGRARWRSRRRVRIVRCLAARLFSASRRLGVSGRPGRTPSPGRAPPPRLLAPAVHDAVLALVSACNAPPASAPAGVAALRLGVMPA